MKRIHFAIATLLGAVAPMFASAQIEQMRPGLWEQTGNMRSQSGQMEQALRQMQEQMASLPPEQRKMIEQQMASRGASVGMAPGGAVTVKLCLTREDIERGFAFRKDENCKHEVTQRSGNTMRIRFTCTGNPPTSGEGEMTVLGPTAYKGKMVMNTVVNGKPERMEMDQAGKWLSADCGKVKPMPR